MLGSKKSNAYFGRNIKEEELKAIAEAFKQKCIKNNIEVPPKVDSELVSRIKQAGKGGDTKPKLNFNGAGINTQYTMLLVETLAASPVIAKLELGNNDLSDKAALYLLRLMKGQLKLMKIAPDKRLHGVFLGSIDISENSEPIDQKILDELTKYSEILTYCNAQTTVRRLYKMKESPETISVQLLTTMWKEIIGKPPSKSVVESTMESYARTAVDASFLTYEECQNALLQELQELGAVPILSRIQYELFLTSEQVDMILPTSGRAITKRSSSSSSLFKRGGNSTSLFDKMRRSSSTAGGMGGGVSDTSSHSIQSKASANDEKMNTSDTNAKSNDDNSKSKKNNYDDDNNHLGTDKHTQLKKSKSMYAAADDHEYAYLYDLIDTTSDGKLSTTEFIRALKNNPSVAEALHLPTQISKNDGTRDQVVIVFNEMDHDMEGLIDIRKFLRYIDNMDRIAAERKEKMFIENEERREREREERRRREKEQREQEEEASAAKKAEEERQRLEEEKRRQEEQQRVEENSQEEERAREQAEEKDRLQRDIEAEAERRQAEEERILAEKEEAEEKARQALYERFQRQKAEAEAEERERKEQLQRDKDALAEEARLLKEQEDAEEAARVEAERLIAEAAMEEENRIRRENEEKLAAAEAERVLREEEEAKQLQLEKEEAEEQERLQKEQNEKEAAEFAQKQAEEKAMAEAAAAEEQKQKQLAQEKEKQDQLLEAEIARKKERKEALARRARELRLEKERAEQEQREEEEEQQRQQELEQQRHDMEQQNVDSMLLASPKVPVRLLQSNEEHTEADDNENANHYQEQSEEQEDGSRQMMLAAEDDDSPPRNSYSAVHSQRVAERQEAIKSSQRRGSFFGTYDADHIPPPPPSRQPLHHEESVQGFGQNDAITVEKGVITAKYREYTEIEVPPEAMEMIYNNKAITRKKPAMSFIHTLVLSHNNLTLLSCSSLESLVNLTHLDFSYNMIAKIKGPLPSKLETLKLHRNRLRKIDSALTACTHLTELDLSHNLLRGVVGLPPCLLRLDLSNNQIHGELNLRMLSLVPRLTSLAVEGNPVLAKFKNCNAHLLTLIPKLEVINYQVLPRAHHSSSGKVSPTAATASALSMRRQDRGRARSRQSMSAATTTSRHKAAPKRRSLSPSKRRKSEQEAHIAALASSYEFARKNREKILQKQDEEALAMSKITAHAKLTPAQLEESYTRMNAWKPHYLKRLEEEDMRQAELKHKELEKKRLKDEELANTPRKRIFGLRSASKSPTSGRSVSSRSRSPGGGGKRKARRSTEKLFGVEARKALCGWMTQQQVTMSAAYAEVCTLVDKVCAEAEADNSLSYTRKNSSMSSSGSLGGISSSSRRSLSDRQAVSKSSTRRGSFFGMYKPEDVPEGPTPFDSLKQHYREVMFNLMEDIRLSPIPHAHVDDDIAEDTVNWHTDVQNCHVVLSFLHSCLVWSGLELFSFRDLTKSLITRLQRDEYGTPLEFVAWGSCAKMCQRLQEGQRGAVNMNAVDITVPSSEYSPIHGQLKDDSDLLLADEEGTDGKENTNRDNQYNDMSYRYDNVSYGNDGVHDDGRNNIMSSGNVYSSGGRSRLADDDVDARMNNLRHRVLQRNQLAGSMIPNHYVVAEKRGEEKREAEAMTHYDEPFHLPLPPSPIHPSPVLSSVQEQQQQQELHQMQEEAMGQPERHEDSIVVAQPFQELQQQVVVASSPGKEKEKEEQIVPVVKGESSSRREQLGLATQGLLSKIFAPSSEREGEEESSSDPEEEKNQLVEESKGASTPKSTVRTAPNESDSELKESMMAHPSARLFHLIDRNGDGELTLTEFIVALRKQPRVAALMQLPQVIHQEDGSRDQCVLVFNAMDDTNTGYIDLRKFLKYVDMINDKGSELDTGTTAKMDSQKSGIGLEIETEGQRMQALLKGLAGEEELDEDEEHEESVEEEESDEDQQGPASTLRLSTQLPTKPSLPVSPNSTVSSLTDVPVSEGKEKENGEGAHKSLFDRSDSLKKEDNAAADVFSKMESLKTKMFSPSPSLSLPSPPAEQPSSSKAQNQNQNQSLVLPTSGMRAAGEVPRPEMHTSTSNISALSSMSSSPPPSPNANMYRLNVDARLFQLMDLSGRGELSLTSFILGLHSHPEICKALKLPETISPEDGTRDECVRAFNAMDDDQTDTVNLRKFLKYYNAVNSRTGGAGVGSGQSFGGSFRGSFDENEGGSTGREDSKEIKEEVIDTPFLSGLMDGSFSSASEDSQDSAPEQSSVASSIVSTSTASTARERLRAKMAANKLKKNNANKK